MALQDDKPSANAVSQFDGLLAKQRKVSRARTWKRNIPLWLMILPGLAYLIANNYLPMFGILIAFKKVNFSQGILQSPWVGLDNFEFLFATKDAWIMIRNTLAYNFVFITVGVVVAVTIAILMAEISSRRIAKFIQPTICFPSMVSAVILSYIVYSFLSVSYGFVNSMLGDNAVKWYSEAKYWPIILFIVHFWTVSGQSSIVYMAAISGIDKSLYEAAQLDGASKMQQVKFITIPLIRMMIILMLLLSIGRIFNSDFGLFYQVTLNSGMLYSTTQTIDTYVFRALMEMRNVGMSSAASVFQAVLGFVLVILSNAFVRKVDNESALF